MNARALLALVSAAVLVAAAAVLVSKRSGPERQAPVDRPVLTSLADSLDSVSEVRLSRGDGTATTLQRRDNGWFVAQRNYPADPGKLRSLLISLSGLRVIETKTSDPARYAALGVEDATGAQSKSIRIEVVAGPHTWSLLLGKAAEPDGSFVRVAGQPAALSVAPRLDVDPQPARWILPQVLDVAADHVQRVAVHPAMGPSYWLARDARGAADLTLHGVPAGRKPAGAAMLDGAAGVLSRLNVDDVKERRSAALEHPSQASFRTFDGLQLDLDGYREANTAWIRIHASEDAETARRFAPSQPPAVPAKAPSAGGPEAQGAGAKSVEAKSADTTSAEAKNSAAKSPDAAAEAAAINARAQGFDFQIPSYQYDQIFRPLTDLLAPLPQHATPAAKKGHG
jgi:uncharacterized protein DUF4340